MRGSRADSPATDNRPLQPGRHRKWRPLENAHASAPARLPAAAPVGVGAAWPAPTRAGNPLDCIRNRCRIRFPEQLPAGTPPAECLAYSLGLGSWCENVLDEFAHLGSERLLGIEPLEVALDLLDRADLHFSHQKADVLQVARMTRQSGSGSQTFHCQQILRRWSCDLEPPPASALQLLNFQCGERAFNRYEPAHVIIQPTVVQGQSLGHSVG